MFASHQNFDQTGAGLSGDFNVAQLVLGFLHVVLHRLGLLHEAGELSFVEHGESLVEILKGKKKKR